MSRGLIALLIATPAYADGIAQTTTPADEVGDQGISAEVGVAFGGRDTPGGLRIAAHYTYQLSDTDWFDGTAAFTFGGTAPECFHDRTGTFVCEHDSIQGDGIEVAGAIRRLFAAQGKFRPFARAGVGLSVVRFSGDSVTGVTFPLHVGGGLRAQVADGVAVVAQAELAAGIGVFGHGLGVEPQLGAAITAGAEFRLR